MVTFAAEQNMHYPVMTEQQVAARWKVSLKTLRRWRQNKIGPAWHKLFRRARYHEAEVFDFEQQSAQHWLMILGDRERVPRIVTHPPKDTANPNEPNANPEPSVQYISAKEVAVATGLPIYFFQDCNERDRKRIPHLMMVGILRFSMEAVLQWELANSVPGNAPEPAAEAVTSDANTEPEVPMRVPRWHELAREQCNSIPSPKAEA